MGVYGVSRYSWGMTEKLGDYIFVVTVITLGGLFVGYTIGGWFGGLPLMVIAGIFGHRHMRQMQE